MEKQNRLLTLGAGMASVAAIVGGSVFMIGSGSASAADSTGSQTAAVVSLAGPNGADHAAEQAAYITALAAKLGISETQLTDALKSVQLDQIAKAVKDGKLTQSQADALSTRINSGTAPLFGFGGGPGRDGGPRGGGAGFRVDETALATFLGVDQPTLETALHGGKSLATVATESGKSRDQLKAFLSSELMTSLNNAVADGKLTQAEADTKLAEATANLDARIDQAGPVAGARHGKPGMMPPPADGS